MHSLVKDLSGQRFGKLVAQKYEGSSKWLCLCDCGNTTIADAYALTRGNHKSCGCIRGNHGCRKLGATTPEYEIWRSMRRRCNSSKHHKFHAYGARGITVDPSWLGPDGFAKFLADMGTKPSPDHSLERKDNNGPYSPENCVWSTAHEQNRNKRTNVVVEYEGRSMILKDWAAHFNINYETFRSRIKKWGVEEAFKKSSQAPPAKES